MTEKTSNHNIESRISPIDLEHPKNVHDFQIILTGSGKKVLEFGPASGYVSKILRERGCHITGIELNSTFAKEAEKFSDRIIVGDAETLNFDEVLGAEKYDVILMANFLECLKDPTQLLKKLHKFLAPNGYIVCSVPNIAHATIRVKLLNGEFRYGSTGLLNEDNLRFFTLDTILHILLRGGYSMTKLYRVKEDINLAYHADLKRYTIPEELMESILKDPEATTVQYVFSAVPSSDTDIDTKEWLMEFSKDITTERLKEILHYYREYLRGILEKRIQYLEREKDSYNMLKIEKDSQIASLQYQLDAIHQSFTWRMLRKYDNSIGKIIGLKRKKK